ncbi:MAG: AMP-binding protein [Bacteroidia bacterium]|nr:AMP-binding protein [Bacteroidia bacterium]
MMIEISQVDKTKSVENQTIALKAMLEYLSNHSPYYRNVFMNDGIDISAIHTIHDLTKLPLTSKDDLQNHNWDFLCVEKNKIADYCTTSGTLGLPVTIALTAKDLDRLALNEYYSLLSIGATSSDIFQFMLTLDRQFMAGIAYYSGVRKLGAGLVRVGPGNAAMQLDAIARFHPTVLIAVPSFLVSVIKASKEKHFDLNASSVRKVLCIGENIRNEDFSLNTLGSRIRQDWNVELYSTYASTEQQTAFTECGHGKGGHHLEDLIIFEVLDDNNKQVDAGMPGELVITTLGVEGMPLLRYKTGDICKYHTEVCQCGKATSRLSPIIGRKQQMIKYNGTTLYPQNIFNVLNNLESIEDYVIVLSKNELGTDDLQIDIVMSDPNVNETTGISKLLQSALRISPALRISTIAEVHKIQMKGEKRKANKFLDLR